MSTNTKLARRMRARRHARQFERALRDASPSVRQELIAAAARDVNR
jgi:hypothetical protein